MQTATTKRKWAGRILSGSVVLFLLFDCIFPLIMPAPVAEEYAHLGLPPRLSVPIAIILALCTALYALPATSVLGAVLLTGYFGGAMICHLRVGDPLFSAVLFPVYVGVAVWAGLYLRDGRLRALIPLLTRS